MLFRVLEIFFLKLPRAWALAFGRYMGTTAYFIFKKRRWLAFHNLVHALSPLDRYAHYSKQDYQALNRRVFQHLGITAVEFFRMAEIHANNLHHFVSFKGLDTLKKAYAQKKGVLILSAHLGNWELLAASLSLSGFNMSMIVKKARQRSTQAFLERQRCHKNILLFSGKQMIKPILKQLSAGGLVGIVLDQHASHQEGIESSFFGRKIRTLKSLAVLSKRTQAVILPVFICRDKNNHHCITVHDPVTHDPSVSVEQRTQMYMHILEKTIEKHPEQWLWTHNFWKG